MSQSLRSQICANPDCCRNLTSRKERTEKRKDKSGNYWCIRCYKSVLHKGQGNSSKTETFPLSYLELSSSLSVVPQSSSSDFGDTHSSTTSTSTELLSSVSCSSASTPIAGSSLFVAPSSSQHSAQVLDSPCEGFMEDVQMHSFAVSSEDESHDTSQESSLLQPSQEDNSDIQRCANPDCCRNLTKRMDRKEKRRDREGKYWCIPCYNTYRSLSRELSAAETSPEALQGDVECQYQLSTSDPSHSAQEISQDALKLQLRFRRTVATRTSCIFKCSNTLELVAVPKSVRLGAFSKAKVLIPERAVCCKQHIVNDRCLNDESLTMLKDLVYKDNTEMSVAQVESLVFDLLDKMVFDEEEPVSVKRFSDKKIKIELGVSREEFEKILNESNAPEFMTNQIALYLNQMYTNDSQERLAENWKVSQPTVSRWINDGRDYLIDNFVHRHLGRSHITRQLVLNNTTEISKRLYNMSGDNIITVWDGTYIYLSKSSNYIFQKKTWSQQKLRNLNKPMMSCTTNGYIIEAFEFFPPGTNDAEALRNIMTTRWFKGFFKRGDVFVLDRGFRDVQRQLENEGFIVYMPSFLDKRDSQLQDTVANQSRLCTMIRWIIEAVNMRVKRFKYLAATRPTMDQRHLYNDLQIASAIENAFGSRLVAHKDNVEIANRALELVNRRNLLQNVVKPLIKKRQGYFVNMEDYEGEIPQLEEEDFINLGGPYHLSQAKSYYAVSMSGENARNFEVLKETVRIDYEGAQIQVVDPLLLRSQIKSRFFSHKIHTAFVLFDKAQTGSASIVQAYCTCRAGARVLDLCVHSMVVVWYLCYARHCPSIINPAEFLNELCPSGVIENSESEETDEE